MRKTILLILLTLVAFPTLMAANPKFPADELFNDKNLRNPNTDVTIINSDNNCYRKIEVTNDPELVARIKKVFAQDEKFAHNRVEKFSGAEHRIILNMEKDGCHANVCLTVTDDANATYWIQYCPPAKNGD